MAKYKGIFLKLNTVSDLPVLLKLEGLRNKQGYIKELIKSDYFIYKNYKKEGTNE